jgi:nucleotide-binding universal stress UspA family protein
MASVAGDERVAITLLHVGTADDAPEIAAADGPQWTFTRVVREGEPVEQILSAADDVQADLIVMPTAGHTGVFDALRGSTTERVLRRTPCPLLAVPAPNSP